jgi:hypothetical protein
MSRKFLTRLAAAHLQTQTTVPAVALFPGVARGDVSGAVTRKR